jgi:hypothetical protein
MTGGLALVADFRNGLFGPVGTTGAATNRHAQFGAASLDMLPGGAPAPQGWTSISDDDRAARYMAWMGLGGTPINIPLALLQIVAVTRVLDQTRALASSELSANMLSQAKALCRGQLGPSYADWQNGALFDTRPGHGYLDAGRLNRQLIFANGDAELWLKLCTLANPSPVHILTPDPNGGPQLRVGATQNSQFLFDIDNQAPGALLPSSAYPPNTPVGNHSAGVDPSLVATNEWPWCVNDAGASAAQESSYANNGLPICPPAVKAAAGACSTHQPGATCFGTEEANHWAVRGAVNAGFAVFLYVESIESSQPKPDYNQCDQL